ncbi:MAG: DUF3108 domain-containing protein [Thiohalorhabdus sp.]|uniref:DUF3108 domain-containing protein n=1 Tax=Thiohalorhabdus sp. TaxID=3094134 RepID=UPI00397F7637
MTARRPLRPLLLFSGFLLAFPALGQDDRTSSSSAWEIGFEELYYDVRWSGMKAGKGMFRAYPSNTGLVLRAQICSSGFVEAFYPVRDQIYTSARFKNDELMPQHNRITQIERGRTKEKTLDFQSGGKVLFRKGDKEKTIEIPEGTLDVLSAIYTIRRMPLNEQEERRLPLIDGKKRKTLVVPAMDRVEEDGKELLRVEPYTVGPDGKRKGGDDWLLHLTPEGHIPVRMNLDLSFGSLDMRLTKVRREPGDDPDSPRMFCDEEVRMPR